MDKIAVNLHLHAFQPNLYIKNRMFYSIILCQPPFKFAGDINGSLEKNDQDPRANHFCAMSSPG